MTSRKYTFAEALRENAANTQAWEVGYPANAVGEEFARIARINFLGARDGEHPPPRPVLEIAWALVDDEIRALPWGEALLKGTAEKLTQRAAKILERKVRELLRTGQHLQDNAPATIEQKGANAPLRTPGAAAEGDRFLSLLTVRPAEPAAD